MEYIKVSSKNSTSQLKNAIKEQLARNTDNLPLLILCIGTDKVVGDSFGPLVGEMIQRKRLENTSVMGTLKMPVHALNLHTINTEGYFTIALDSTLGDIDNVGKFLVSSYAVTPGKAVGKDLLPMGDASICAILGKANDDYKLNLQAMYNIRLYHVYTMAQTTVRALLQGIKEFQQEYSA